MSTHRRAWIIRAGVVVVVAAASLFGIASPAFAAEPTITITSLPTGSLMAGQSVAMKFTVKNNNGGGQTQADIKITFPNFNGEMSCQGSCDFTQAINDGETSPEFTATLRAGSVPAGESRNGQVRIRATIANQSSNADRDLTVQGPAQPPQPVTVPEVSGQVVDVYTGKSIPAAKVFIQDSGTPVQNWEVGTDSDGKFKIVSKQEKPISPGTIVVRVEKDTIQPYSKTVQGNPGQPLAMGKLTVAPIASPQVTPSAGISGGISPDPSLLGGETDPPLQNEQESGLSWILIAVGGVLVLLGIGAIVLLFVRKRDDGADDDRPAPRRGGPPGGPPGRGGPRGPMPPRHGGPPERTTVMRGPGHDPRGMRPVSPGPRADQTMIARSPLADVPTQMHPRMPAEHVDPYASPARQNGAHGAYGPTQPGGYPQQPGYPGGAPGYGQQPDPYAQPGHGQPGYGQPGHAPQPDPYAQPGYGQPGAHDPYPQGGGHDPRGPRPGPTPHGDGRRVDWLDD